MPDQMSGREQSIKFNAEALRLTIAGEDCLEKAKPLLMQGHLREAGMILSEFMDQSAPFFSSLEGKRMNPIVNGLGAVLVRVYLMRAVALVELARPDPALRNQYLPVVRDELECLMEWPDEWFEDDTRPLFEDLKRRFSL